MKGIAKMSPADFQSEYGSHSSVAHQSRPALHVVGQDRAPQNDGGQAPSSTAASNQKAGFLNQSIDEIARLYVESPFSW